jgi:hypothetical protein
MLINTDAVDLLDGLINLQIERSATLPMLYRKAGARVDSYINNLLKNISVEIFVAIPSATPSIALVIDDALPANARLFLKNRPLYGLTGYISSAIIY